MQTNTENQVIAIGNTSLPIIEYRGKRVVTFAMVDKVHQRPEGTASRNFLANKNRFIADEDFYLIDYAKNHEFRGFGIEVPPRGLTLLTQTGYLMLVKSFTDNLAWEIQRELVNRYFQTLPVPSTTPVFSEYPLAAEIFEANLRVARLLEVPAHLAQIESIKTAHRETGVDFHHLLAHTPAQNNIPDEEMMLEPRDLGIRLGIDQSGKTLNRMLEHIGWQARVNDTWQPTEAGKPHCQAHSWKTGEKSGYNLKWRVDAVRHELLKYEFLRAA